MSSSAVKSALLDRMAQRHRGRSGNPEQQLRPALAQTQKGEVACRRAKPHEAILGQVEILTGPKRHAEGQMPIGLGQRGPERPFADQDVTGMIFHIAAGTGARALHPKRPTSPLDSIRAKKRGAS